MIDMKKVQEQEILVRETMETLSDTLYAMFQSGITDLGAYQLVGRADGVSLLPANEAYSGPSVSVPTGLHPSVLDQVLDSEFCVAQIAYTIFVFGEFGSTLPPTHLHEVSKALDAMLLGAITVQNIVLQRGATMPSPAAGRATLQ
ncbi:hypothetical protein ELH70_14620 [Rhizobium ruizarguesonis]|uniref:hypothetical protein n=1 Tax=Rhizobium ruizarguesonis TaxID=2081791 RepID=UPI0010318561|nr:hypothetical protein [Rhizobium ruizarguesonis]TAZ73804.1 hypothetical protein ELH70_14620 [Rhizobium ruizarguesonis]TBA00405.1 hypothetical protein ELH69_13805 [Rhizobium ruizarguesonis]